MASLRVCFFLFALLAAVSASSVLPVDRPNNVFLDGETVKTEDIEYGLIYNNAMVLMAEHNLTHANEIFGIDFIAVTEVLSNGTAARNPIPLNQGKWNFQGAEYQDDGGVYVVYYTQIIPLDGRTVEVDIVLAIANNRTTFFTLYGNHTLEKDDLKVGVLVNNWPFYSDSNNLNVTMVAWSDRSNSTKVKRENSTVVYSEFGESEKVLRINFEKSCILDGNKADNVTVWEDDDQHLIYITLPHHEQFVYYDPMVTIAEPGSSGSGHTVLIVVLCIVGALILLACIALMVFFIWRRRRQNYEIIE